MLTENLEKQLATLQKWLLIACGAAATFLALAISDIPNRGMAYFPSWFPVWLIVQLAVTPMGIALLHGKTWRQLPFAARKKTAFGYLLVSWVTVFAFGLKMVSEIPFYSFWDGFVCFMMVVGGFGVIFLILAYLAIRRERPVSPGEEMFP